MGGHGRGSFFEGCESERFARLLGEAIGAAGLARGGDERGDEFAVRRGARAVRQIDRVFEAGAQIAAELGGAPVQRPDLLRGRSR